ncbi:MAG: hydroxysqualene dehydroxylase HpnE [bacterium]
MVVGGGAAGMSAALALAEAGRRVTLLEAGALLGGRARSFRDRRSATELDWGPHLFMAANPALRDLLRRIGAAPRLRLPPALDLTYRLADPAAPGGVRLARLAFPPEGGVLARLAALLRWRGPGPLARLGIARGLLRALSSREGGAGTVEEMLVRLGQGEAAREWFWEPFARAVLNLPLGKGSAALFRRVLLESFGAGPQGAALGTPDLPLGAFWAAPAAERIRSLGGEVRTKSPARRILIEGGRSRGVLLPGGERVEADAVVAAVPPPALLALLPEELRGEAPWRDVARLRPGPIASAYLWLDRPAPGPPFEALMGEPWHWLFRPTAAAPEGEGAGPLALLAGGEDSIAAQGRGRLEDAARETLSRLLPGCGIRRVLVVRERAATWANGADEQDWRPGPETPIGGLCLAGDWTATGLPATVEGAVRSGRLAAELILTGALSSF